MLSSEIFPFSTALFEASVQIPKGGATFRAAELQWSGSELNQSLHISEFQVVGHLAALWYLGLLEYLVLPALFGELNAAEAVAYTAVFPKLMPIAQFSLQF